MSESEFSERAQAARRVTTAIADELGVDAGDRRYDELMELGSDLREQVGGIVRAVRGSNDRLPAAEACRQVSSMASEMLELATGDAFALGCLDIEQDLSDLIRLVAGFDVADRLQGVSVGEASRETGLAKGFVSELRQAKKGLPSRESASKLDQYLDDQANAIGSIVEEAKRSTRSLQSMRKTRGSSVAPGGVVIPSGLRDRDRVEAAAERMRRDDALLQLVEQVSTLSPRERRAIARLIAELTED